MCEPPRQAWDPDSPERQASVDEGFLHLLRVFRPSGGLVSAVARCHAADASSRDDDVAPICFVHDQRPWLPSFQFEAGTGRLRPSCGAVIRELESVFDGWDLAQWFASGNIWLGNQRPVDLLDSCPECVLGAARADRFIAVG